MKKFFFLTALAAGLSCAPGVAQQFQFAGFRDVETAFASQQAELNQLRAQLAAFQDAEAEPVQDVVGGKGCCCDPCYGGWYAGAEAVILLDHGTDGYKADNSEVGYRLWAGYEGCDGLGVAVRFFDYDNGGDSEYGNELWYLDLELTTNFCICNTDITLSGGYRHADVHLQDDYAIWNNANGVTFGMRVSRDISCNLTAFAWLQESFLYGTDDYDDYSTSHFNWTEAQLGVQYNTCVAGTSAWLRAGVEAQDIAAPFDSYYYDAPGEFGYFIGGGVNY